MTDERAIEILEGMNMQDEQKQIEEMAKDLEEARHYAMATVGSLNNGFGGWYGAYMYKKGYRKASEVIDEFVDKVLEKIKYEYENYPNAMTVGTYHQLRKEINELAAEMRKEVK